MRSVFVFLLFSVVFAIAAPTAWAGYQICDPQGSFSTAPCGKIIPNGFPSGESCIGSYGCPAGQSCTPESDPSVSPLLLKSYIGANCVSTQENATDDESTLPDPVTFTPNVEIPGFPTTTKVNGRTAGDYIRALYVYFVGVVGVFAVVMIMYAGFIWITAAGNAGKITQAKEQMNGAVIGLILMLTSFLLLQLVNPELVKLRDLNLPTVPRILQPAELTQSSEKGVSPTSFDPGKVGNANSYDAMFLAKACPDRDLAFRLKAIMIIESGGRATVISSANAVGLMQLLPGTAHKTVAELQDPQTNITAGAAYVAQLRARTCPARATLKSGKVVDCTWPEGQQSCIEGGWKYIAAAYNGGLGANCASKSCPGKTWWECEQNPGFAETRNYVVKFETALKVLTNNNWLPNCP